MGVCVCVCMCFVCAFVFACVACVHVGVCSLVHYRGKECQGRQIDCTIEAMGPSVKNSTLKTMESSKLERKTEEIDAQRSDSAAGSE